jgi:hypothetical protein
MELASGQPGLMIYYKAESPAVRASTSLSDDPRRIPKVCPWLDSIARYVKSFLFYICVMDPSSLIF